MTQLTEQDLVAECRRGRRQAQYELYRRYQRAMFGTCLRMCGSREDAEDVLQGSFADVFGKLDRFRGESTVGAWIKRIVVNNCLNHLKRRRVRFDELRDDHGGLPAEDPPGLHADAADDSARVRAIQAAVRELPDGYRTVLTLYLFEGLDHAEIADVLGISEQTSKSQYSRARRRLRERLQQTAHA